MPLRRIWLIRAHIQNCPYPFAIMLPIPVFIHTRMGYPTGRLHSCNSAVCTHTRSTRRRPHPESPIFTRSTSSGHPPNGSAAALPVLPALLHLLVLISSTKSIRPLHHGSTAAAAYCSCNLSFSKALKALINRCQERRRKKQGEEGDQSCPWLSQLIMAMMDLKLEREGGTGRNGRLKTRRKR